MALTTADLQALRRFAQLPEGRVMVAVLVQKLGEADEKLRTATGEHLYRTQGRAQALDELLRDLTESDLVLKRQEQPRATGARALL